MKLFLLLMLLSSQVYAKSAEQCLNETIRLTIAFKMKSAMLHNALGEESGKPKTQNELTVSDLCSKTENIQSDIEGTKNDKLKMVKITLRELKEKGKISGSQFGSDKEYVKESDVCEEINKGAGSTGFFDESCPNTEAAVTAKIKAHPYESTSFEKNCVALAKVYLDSKVVCDNESKKSSEVKRDPPGEEIAPAEEPSVQPALKKESETIKRATIKFPPSPASGASAQ